MLIVFQNHIHIRMPHEFRYRSDVSPGCNGLCSKGMSEIIWCEFFVLSRP